MKEFEKYVTKNIKVYLNTELNKAKFNDSECLYYTADGNYVLACTRELLDEATLLLKAFDNRETMLSSTFIDIIYDNALIEANYDFCPVITNLVKIKGEKGRHEILRFNDFPLDCFINIKDAETNGSEVVFISTIYFALKDFFPEDGDISIEGEVIKDYEKVKVTLFS